MNLLKWGGISIFAVILSLVIVTLHPKISDQLASNIKKNFSRSFRDSGMETQLKKLDLSFWPISINWSLLKIYRTTSSDLPNSWRHIFQSMTLTGCGMKMLPSLFKLRLEINCSKINLRYLPLKWAYVPSLERGYALDFFFTNSDFRNLENKQGWIETSIKTDNFSLNGEELGSLNMAYNFISKTEFEYSLPDLKEKILFSSKPGQLEIFSHGSRKNFGLLNKSLFFEIMKNEKKFAF